MQVVIYTPETLSYPFSYSHPDPAVRGRTIDYMRQAMEDALALGTDRVFLNTGCHPRDLDREEGWPRTWASGWCWSSSSPMRAIWSSPWPTSSGCWPRWGRPP